jgi:nitrite reductase/ring-hydroxylating ferredoxin subunit
MATPSLKRKFWQRMLGISATKPPANPDCWTYQEGKITVSLAQAPELAAAGTGIRLEGKGLPRRVLLVHGDDGAYYAYHNKCRHFGRRLDPVPGSGMVQCCSVNKATYDAQGNVVAGPARGSLVTYDVEASEGTVVISLAGDPKK